MTEVLCDDCDGGAERCVQEGHLRSWEIETDDPDVAVFMCARCSHRFDLPRCASCGEVIERPSAPDLTRT